MKFDEYVRCYLGKKIDYDSLYGVQCVDLVNHFADKVLGISGCFYGPRYAKDIWNDRNKYKKIYSNFDFIVPKYKNFELQTGDIGVRTSGVAGHIFIVSRTNANDKIYYYDENEGDTHSGMTLREKPYSSSYVNGILRPKNQSNLKGAPIYLYGNAKMKSEQDVYADSILKNKIGTVFKNERVYYEGSGDGHPIIVYRYANNQHYKAGFVASNSVLRD